MNDLTIAVDYITRGLEQLGWEPEDARAEASAIVWNIETEETEETAALLTM